MSTVLCPSCGARFPVPLRTTGERSQNHAVHGFASQIERYMADGTSKREVIEEAARRAGIPWHHNHFGAMVYKHEPEWTKDEASKVITELREIAQFLGCRLVEINE